MSTTYTCDEPGCGRTFESPQALGGHRFRVHGKRGESQRTKQQRKAATNVVPVLTPRGAAVAAREGTLGSVASTVREQLRTLASPLQDQLDEIEERLLALDTEARDLREARNQINLVLARLTSNGKPAKPTDTRTDANALRAERQLQEKADFLASIFKTRPEEFAGGFTSNKLSDALTAEVPRGLSTKSARAALELLRERGVVRHDRVVKGGGMQFKLVDNVG